jgi:hypothetical protein
MSSTFALPHMLAEERTPLVEALLGIISGQAEQIAKQAEQIQRAKEQIQALRDEVAIGKGLKPKPKIPTSKLEESQTKDEAGKSSNEKRAGSAKRTQTEGLEIHETVTLNPEGLSEDWVCKGYNDFIVQGLGIETHNIQYRRGRWRKPNGETVMAPLPADVSSHFSATLLSSSQHQDFACRVTQPLLLDQLREIGIAISSGQLKDI